MTSQDRIVPRDLHFALDQVAPRHWCAGDPARTAIFDALSILFPEGEGFFIASIGHFRAKIVDPDLRRAIAAFSRQEAFHSREHLGYNQGIGRRLGDTAERLDAEVKAGLEAVTARLGHRGSLAVTCALEHFTAIMSDVLLRDPQFLAGADPEYLRLWRWHAVEEIEHKAVAFDVLLTVTPWWQRYALRTGGMALTTVLFNYYVFKHIFNILKAEGLHRRAGAWRTVMNQLYGRPGMFRRIFLPWADFFRPGFHPWQRDNRPLIERHKAALEPR